MNEDSPVFDDVSPRRSSTAQNRLVMMIVLILCAVVAGFWLFGRILDARTAARMSVSRNHLKQIGLAIHNYHDTHGTLPAAWIADADGNGSLSWMYSILPFMDARDVFQKIDSNSPWNDPGNRPQTQTVIEEYLNSQIPQQVDEDGFVYSHYAGNSQLFKPNQFRDFRDIPDGLATTLMVGEINDGFEPWAKPGNTRDPALGLNKGPETFGSPFKGGVHFMVANGSVVFLSNDIDPDVLKALATPNGGETIDKEKLNQNPPSSDKPGSF